MDWKAAFPNSDIRLGEPMSEHTTFKVGGPADAFLSVRSDAEIVRSLEIANEKKIPVTVIGNGSNLLVRDGGIRGLVIAIDTGMDGIEVSGNVIRAEAGARLKRIAQEACSHGLTGLEFAAGIPGNLGGAVAMNAGAYGGEMAQVVTRIEALTMRGEKVVLNDKEGFAFGYRQSRVKRDGLIVLRTEMTLVHGDMEAIRAKMDEYAAKRRASQPLDKPSAGSVFKRPEGYFAGRLIEDAGMKGACIGGAQVSPKHAGFIVNNGGATPGDIERLIKSVREKVYESSGVTLETEIRILGERYI